MKSQAIVSNQHRKAANSLRMIRGQELVWAKLSEVHYFQAQRKYTRVVLKDGEGLLRMGITTAVRFLNPDHFWRIHRSLVLNVAHMASAKRDEFGRLTVKLIGREERMVVSKPYEHLFRDGFS